MSDHLRDNNFYFTKKSHCILLIIGNGFKMVTSGDGGIDETLTKTL